MQHIVSSVLVLVVICCCVSALLVTAQQQDGGNSNNNDATLLHISAPEMYPDYGGPFEGMVQITFNNNAPNSEIHYIARPGPFEGTDQGTSRIVPGAGDRRYSGEPVQISTVGETTVYAVAISTVAGRGNSRVIHRTYTVKRGAIDPPTATPPEGHYVGGVNVRILPAETSASGVPVKCDIRYSIDDPNPGEGWVSAPRGASIELDMIGQHRIYAMCIAPAAAPSTTATPNQPPLRSAVVRFSYEIAPELKYDVGSECSKCSFAPSEGEYFTVVLQGARSGARFFLTTAMLGCERMTHFLDYSTPNNDGHTPVTVGQTQRTWKFWGSEATKVWLCYSAPGSSDYSVVPRRGSVHTYFEIARGSAVGDVGKPPAENTPPPERMPNVGGVTPSSGTNGSILITALLGVVLLFVGVWVVKIVRVMVNTGGNAKRRHAVPSSSEGGAAAGVEGASMVSK